MSEKEIEQEVEEKIEKEVEKACKTKKKKWHEHYDGTAGWVYFLGFIAAAVYYVQESSGFWPGVLGVLKAIIWPAMLIYKVFTMLHM